MLPEQDHPTPGRLMAGLAMTAALGSLSAVLPLLPRTGEPVAILAPSQTQESLIAAIAEAGGALVGLRGSKIALAMPGGPDFLSRLRTLGYWLILDARAVDLCGNIGISPGGALARQSR